MEKVRIEIDLLALKGAKCDQGNIVIPVVPNAISLRTRKDGTCFSIFKLNAFQRKEVGKYNETHILKNTLTDEEKTKLAAGQEIDNPIIGNVKMYSND